MALNQNKIKVQIIRMWKGDKKEPGNSIEMIVLDSSGTQIHATLADEYVRKLLEPSDREGGERKDFSKWINDIGDEKINTPNSGEIEIDISEDLLINECKDLIEAIVNKVYGQSFAQSSSHQEKAILCVTNNDVDQINEYMLSQLQGEEKEYWSADTICSSDSHPDDYWKYPPEYLNSIKVPGLPNHSLKLKLGAPVMLLKDLGVGLRNGTRLSITLLGKVVLEARILTGERAGEKVFIPRMPMETNFPINLRRRQFPLTLAFAMTINKCQGKSLIKVGIFQPRRVFSHGPMYVAISKMKSEDGVKIIITDKDEKAEEETKNVVFKEVS
ncbi:hypothetical protein AALP_AA5G199200 [Arabis alpina]|uniref:DNA helicase Pif1-like 2B domain-containing protein n=1 Tax=Arabis alpina TaxID=50452 RepID=A0A087GY82_ARAAL|nr:hypothetical protein AALP_AA5G199200 [Arabis alpina]